MTTEPVETPEPVSLSRKPADRPPADRDLVVLASKALRQLGEAGRPAEAGALAGKMWWAVKETDPDGAARFNGVMHYLAKLEAKAGAPEETGVDSRAEPEVFAQQIDPSERHAVILGTFRDLPAGAGFILVNSHDPKPLRYQFEAEFSGEFNWNYVESGPENWRIRISRVDA